MTNNAQMVVEDPEADHPLEEVQLTELRPVEQSRIKEVDDGDVTDGLRALRSFSRRHVDELEQFGAGYPLKRNATRWKHLNGTSEFGVDSEEEDCGKDVNNDESTNEKDREESQPLKDNEEEYYGVNGDFEYLEERDGYEIYVYKQKESEGSEVEYEVEDSEKEKKKQSKNVKVFRVERLPTKKGTRPRGRPRKKKRIVRKRKLVEQSPPPTRATESPDLQKKINDIIQANLLMEQENNNIVEDSLEKEKGTPKGKDEDEESKKYSCQMCDARFKGSGGLRNHYKVVHATGPLFKCDDCGKEFRLKERLKLHIRTHTGFKPYKCPECDKTFARGGQLVQHRRTHSQVKPYSCDQCSGTFTCAANLALHLKRHNGQKDHKCDICGRGFVRRDALKKHLECLHRDVKSFLCVICNKTFKGHLPQHMRTHAQDRPHGCATCGQRFAQKSQLTVHQRTHSGQRPFRCLVCWQAFAHSTALKLHTRRHTGERPFKCAECNAGFTQLPHWKKHMKCIHGRNEPYCCRKCNNFFRIKNELEAHEKDCIAEDKDAGDSEGNSVDGMSASALEKYRNMSIEKMRLLLAVLLKRISKPERLDELGFGKRLIDEVLVDSLVSAGKEAVKAIGIVSEFEALRTNLAVFLEWTVPKEHWDNFRKLKKTPEEVLETLTNT